MIKDKEELNRDNKASGVKIWAHRGCCYQYPENTLPAFLTACKLQGITGIELDIHMSADGEMAVIHDETVDRLLNGTGYVKDYPLSELKKLRFKDYPEEGEPVSIPSIREVFDLVQPYCERNGVIINIELKNNRIEYEGLEEKILQTVSEYGLEDYVIYSSFSEKSLIKLKKLEPGVSAGILKRKLSDCIRFGEKHPIDAYHPSIESLETDSNLPEHTVIRAWNEREPFYGQMTDKPIFDLTEYKERGVTDFITNLPELYLG